MENKKMLKVLVKEPYRQPYVKEIEDTLDDKQLIVGGLIECVGMPDVKHVDLYVNEEGKLDRLPGNFWLPEYEDCVVGTCFMIGYDENTGENVSLTDNQIKQCEKYISAYQIPIGLDLYLDFKALGCYMKIKQKEYEKKKQEEM